MKWSYVYALTCPITKQVRYIGQSVNPSLRYEQHLSAPGNPAMYDWLDELKASGLRPGLRIIERCAIDTVSDIEMFWIHHHLALSSGMINARYTKSGKVNTEYRRPKSPRKAKTTKNTIDTVIRFPPDLYEKLRKIAEKEERSINGEVVIAVRQLVARYEQEHGALD